MVVVLRMENDIMSLGDLDNGKINFSHMEGWGGQSMQGRMTLA